MKTSISKFSLVFFTLLGAATAAQAQSEGQSKVAVPSTADKASVEVDFWKSVERMDTADAYAAYLEAYPNGRFALLARIAMRRASGSAQSAPAAAPVPPPAASTVPVTSPASAPATTPMLVQAPVTGGKLNAWSEPASGAITLDAGHRIRGPGVITVGRIGAKKQLSIPKGDWMVLAATDHDSEAQPRVASMPTTNRIARLTTLTLAQFDGTTAKSLLIATFNRLPGDNPNHVWRDAVQCEAGNPKYKFHNKQGGFALKLCAYLHHDAQALVEPEFVPDHDRELQINLLRLGGKLGRFNAEAVSILVDAQASYLRITKLDCLQSGTERPSCTDASAQSGRLEDHVAWIKNYAPQAMVGFTRNLDLSELHALKEEVQRP